MENFMIVGSVLLIVGGALVYIIKEKKKGTKCIGCPHAGTCSAGKNGQGCCSDKE